MTAFRRIERGSVKADETEAAASLTTKDDFSAKDLVGLRRHMNFIVLESVDREQTNGNKRISITRRLIVIVQLFFYDMKNELYDENDAV